MYTHVPYSDDCNNSIVNSMVSVECLRNSNSNNNGSPHLKIGEMVYDQAERLIL